MGIVRVTARPSYYAGLKETEVQHSFSHGMKTGMLSVSMRVAPNAPLLASRMQRKLAVLVEKAIDRKAFYVRDYVSSYDRGHYEVDNVIIYGNHLTIGRFHLTQMEPMLRIVQALDDAGMHPEDDIQLTFYPNDFSIQNVLNLQNILEARRDLIECALHLEEPFMICVDQGLTLSIVLTDFLYQVVEAAACLICQASMMAEMTRKARMKPCDKSNPKYQMRSWLLRLGFIGEQFERPRSTLLNGLTGDTAFFKEEQKQRAVARRRAKRMNGGEG
ncbi:MAG: hypothetical protein IKF90_21115 [Parasporobacterium sp.]|nr:hypothetical protein [Parasporobacterium sp.]